MRRGCMAKLGEVQVIEFLIGPSSSDFITWGGLVDRQRVTRGIRNYIMGDYPMLVGLLLIFKWDTCQVMRKLLKQWIKVVMCSTPINTQGCQTLRVSPPYVNLDPMAF